MQCPQQKVNDYFESSAAYWRQVYSGGFLLSAIYRARQKMTLRWISRLGLPAAARILEVGCGAGLTTVALARNGYTVDALDSTTAMLRMTHKKAVHGRVRHRVRLQVGDAHALPFETDAFDLAIAIGVIPWLHSEQIALQEMHRVLKPGGYLLVTADNNARLNRILDPRSSPVLRPLRLAMKGVLQPCGLWSVDSGFQAKRHYPRQVNRLIAQCNFRKIASCSVGFGPFTMFGKPLFAERTSIRLHRRLQALASKAAFFPLQWTGSHYMVLAIKE
jgi:ubiquinone/menaquinone biosynthesis C-methylase UbiE